MRLKTLKSTMPTLGTKLRTLETKAGATERPRGEAWQNTRARIARRDGYVCAKCGRAWLPSRDHVDHRIPLEQGGSNDDSNLQLLCDTPCHAEKTAAEAAARAGRGPAPHATPTAPARPYAGPVLA